MIKEIEGLDKPPCSSLASEKHSKDDRVIKSSQNGGGANEEELSSLGLTYELLFGSGKSKVDADVPVKPEVKPESKCNKADEFYTLTFVKDELKSMRKKLKLKIDALKKVREEEEKYLDSLSEVRLNM